MQAAGLCTIVAGDLAVATSARREGRAADGFSAVISTLTTEDGGRTARIADHSTGETQWIRLGW